MHNTNNGTMMDVDDVEEEENTASSIRKALVWRTFTSIKDHV